MFKSTILSAVPAILFMTSAASASFPFSFADIVEDASKAVVIISARVDRPADPEIPSLQDLALPADIKDYLGKIYGHEARNRGQKGRIEGIGSGFLIDGSGLVVTNHHVIENAEDIMIELHNGQRVPAKIVGSDEKTDLAVLDIEGEGYSHLKFGKTDTLRVGDVILAIGAPFGLGGSVSSGIISAKGRDIGTGQYDNFLQTDAAINEGNSGGPLLNLHGDVVGVNTAIFSDNVGSVGIGFAIPSEIVQHVVSEISKNGYVQRGWIGVTTIPTPAQIASALGFRRTTGVVITNVEDGSPAAETGLSIGDVIVAFNDVLVNKPAELHNAISQHPLDQPAKISINRSGEQVSAYVDVAIQKDSTKGPKRVRAEYPNLVSYGISVEIKDGSIIVEHVRQRSRASFAGFEAGDEITSVAGKYVSNLDDVENALANAKISVVQVYKAATGEDTFIAVK